jgi:hypothetical protein
VPDVPCQLGRANWADETDGAEGAEGGRSSRREGAQSANIERGKKPYESAESSTLHDRVVDFVLDAGASGAGCAAPRQPSLKRWRTES